MIEKHMIMAAVLIGALVAVGWFGYTKGAAHVMAEWNAEKLAAAQAAEAIGQKQRLQASKAASEYEAQRAALQAQATQARAALRNALQRPICPTGEPNAALTLADVPVPADALRRLRDAGAASAPSP